jgi:hypothetical protein
LQNQAKQVQLKNNIATFDMPDAAESIVNELLKLLKKD